MTPNSLLKNVWFAARGHAAYKIFSEIGMPCRPGALTGRLFQRAPNELSHPGPRTHASPRLLGKPEALPGVDRVYELFSRLLPSARVSLSSKAGTTSASRRPFQLSFQFLAA